MASGAVLIGNDFVFQYYSFLHEAPELVHQFYTDLSIMTRPEEDGTMATETTLQGIKDKILSLNLMRYWLEILSVDTQPSFNEGLMVVVTGCLRSEIDNRKRKFAQTFFLAPQYDGYFVLNDIFRYVDEYKSVDDDNNDDHVPINYAAAADDDYVPINCFGPVHYTVVIHGADSLLTHTAAAPDQSVPTHDAADSAPKYDTGADSVATYDTAADSVPTHNASAADSVATHTAAAAADSMPTHATAAAADDDDKSVPVSDAANGSTPPHTEESTVNPHTWMRKCVDFLGLGKST